MAKAEQGKTYAQILNGHCHWQFTAAELPEWNDEHIKVVDVTGQAVSVGDHYDGTKFTAVVPDLAVIRASLWEAIKAGRDRRKAGGFKVGTQWFHSDADSRIQHLGLKDKARDLLAAGGSMGDTLTLLGQPVKWKTMDGSFAEITAQLAFDIVAAAADLDAKLFVAAEAHKAAVDVSANPADYDCSAGWPETFEG